ncbi:MAG TPA: type II toxin-antitoxin system VapB family antitoxin [Acidimicrobiales bacterium]|nr:type II toxin-antitoxin system VapB family antitoxin [Acidimicrobiales bacterium]
MAREKATITLDRAKAAEARAIVGAASTSEVVDLALDHLIRSERLRGDIAAYRREPPTQSEVDLALLADSSDLADDTDWSALYADDTV